MQRKIIRDKQEIDAIIKKVQVCYVAFSSTEYPYVLPFNFGYDGQFIFLHSGMEGKKMDLLKKDNRICISMCTDTALYAQNEKVACSYSMIFRSIQIFGKAVFVENKEDKIHGLNAVMKQYSEKEFSYSKPSLERVSVMRVEIESVSAIKHGNE